MEKIFIGIDPGLSGAAVALDGSKVPDIQIWESKTAFLTWVKDWKEKADMENREIVICIEQVGGYIPGRPQPASALSKLVGNAEWMEGVVMGLGVTVCRVQPQKWQKGILSLGHDKSKRKHGLRDAAQKMFPQIRCTLTNADALLIANWIRTNAA